MNWRGQDKQDEWVAQNSNQPGVFVDIGAHNGATLSNTWALEKFLGWKGLLIEGNKDLAKDCQKERSNSKTLCVIVGDKNEECTFWNSSDSFLSSADNSIGLNVPGSIPETRMMLHAGSLLIQENIPKDFDYLSIDVEGSDWKVLRAILEFGFEPRLITIEVDKWSIKEKEKRKQTLQQYNYSIAKISAHDWFLEKL